MNSNAYSFAGLCTRLCLGCTAYFAVGVGYVRAELSDEGFDTPYVVNSALPNFLPINTTSIDKWAAEKAEIVTTGDGISPADGNQMVKMLDDGTTGVSNELKQRIDVTLHAPSIDLGTARTLYFACFNVPTTAADANAEIFINYYNGLGVLLSTSAVLSTNGNGGLDQDVATWEHLDFLADVVPVGTRYVEAYTQYTNASLGSAAGYVDKVHLELRAIPEPASLAIMLTAVGGAWAIRRRLRK